MLTKDLLKQLKSGKINQVFLLGKYILKADEDGKVFISRGGKRKYYLEDYLLHQFFMEDNNIRQEINNIYLQGIKELLNELLSNKKLGIGTVIKLNTLNNLIEQLL